MADDPQVQDVDREAADLDALYDEPCPCGKETCALNCDECLKAFLKRIREQAMETALCHACGGCVEQQCGTCAGRRTDIQQAREQAIEECCKAVCPLCESGVLPAEEYCLQGWWWHPGSSKWIGGPCDATRIRRALARSKEGA